MKLLAILFLVAGLQAQQKLPPQMCGPYNQRKPSPVMVDGKGNCPKDTAPMKNKAGKVMFCVVTKQPPPLECKPIKLPAVAK